MGCLWCFLYFCLYAYDCFGAVAEADARATVGAGQDVCFGDEGTELGWCAEVWTDWGVGGEGGVEEG